ncbi:RecQ family ATP-dependent DNA helicase [Ureibacillus massiliensis]|uniref:RecQ family ATP-dependent DNA helicase n=1 Tax=Ureibacillus massiliensis TaxID=292806 RepID=UPI001F4550F6|nr:ATP-dependent DNA helicase RecQ [Ureibacillus massiliensis]
MIVLQLEATLNKYFGYSSFRPGQKEVIEQLVKGQDVIALLPTGMGKSLCYQLPGYIFEAPVLIISPLLSLMQDQVTQMKQNGEKRVIAINSFLTTEQKQNALNYLHQYRFIFISPEMLLQAHVQNRLSQMALSLIVIDEAHCISQWGFDFRPDYLRIGEVFDRENRPPILALSATATDKVLGDVEKYLKMKTPYKYIHSVDRPNIHLGKRFFRDQEDKLQWILQHVQDTEGPGIIYTQSRSKTESISERLLQLGISVASYHAGKDALDRQFIQQQFIEGSLDWIVATNSFGMGVNKQDVRQVIHFSIPSNVASYMQEIGRAGRDGEHALAIILYTDGDEDVARMLATDDLPTEHHIERYAQYISQNENVKNMIQNGEISETALRVLDYWMVQLPREQVAHILTEMKREKLLEIDEMMGIVRTEKCMRERIVHYFGQTLASKPENCCEGCGLTFSDIIRPREKDKASYRPITWRERIESILLGNE